MEVQDKHEKNVPFKGSGFHRLLNLGKGTSTHLVASVYKGAGWGRINLLQPYQG